MNTDGLPDELRETGIYPTAKLAWILMQSTEPITAMTLETVFGLSEAQSSAAFSQLRHRELIDHTEDGYVRDL